MNLEGPVEAVFDTSVIIGAILESYGGEAGDTSRNVLTSLIPYRASFAYPQNFRKSCKRM